MSDSLPVEFIKGSNWPFRWFGFWGEPEDRNVPLPYVGDFMVPEAARPPDREELARYLSGGKPIASIPGYYVVDPISFDGYSSMVSIRTDGVWLWRDDLGELLLKYRLTLPKDLLARIRARNHETPKPGEPIGSPAEWPPIVNPEAPEAWYFYPEPSDLDLRTWGFLWYGYWGDPHREASTLPKIHRYLTLAEPYPDLDKLCAYLNADEAFLSGVMSPQPYVDPVTGEVEMASQWRGTDGLWVWDGSLPRVLRKYPLALPDSLLQHIRDRNYMFPEKKTVPTGPQADIKFDRRLEKRLVDEHTSWYR